MTTFFIADDSPEKMRFLHHMVKRAGWEGEILTAVTSEEAFDVIDAHPEIAAAFIDYYIPTQNGPAIIARLRTSCPDCRIALVTSGENPRNADRARSAGAEAAVCTSHPSDAVERALTDLLEAWMMPR